MEFKFNFPRIGIEIDPNIQIEKMREEMSEVLDAKTNEERDLEVMDLLHACETYFRIRNINPTLYKQNIIIKNYKRNYYKLSETEMLEIRALIGGD